MDEGDMLKVEKITDQSVTRGPDIQTLVRKDVDTDNVVVLICPKRRSDVNTRIFESSRTSKSIKNEEIGAIGGTIDIVSPSAEKPKQRSMYVPPVRKKLIFGDSPSMTNSGWDSATVSEDSESDEEYVETVDVINLHGDTLESTVVLRSTNNSKGNNKDQNSTDLSYEVIETTRRMDTALETINEEDAEETTNDVFYDATDDIKGNIQDGSPPKSLNESGGMNNDDDNNGLNSAAEYPRLNSDQSEIGPGDGAVEINPAELLVVKILRSMRDYKTHNLNEDIIDTAFIERSNGHGMNTGAVKIKSDTMTSVNATTEMGDDNENKDKGIYQIKETERSLACESNNTIISNNDSIKTDCDQTKQKADSDEEVHSGHSGKSSEPREIQSGSLTHRHLTDTPPLPPNSASEEPGGKAENFAPEKRISQDTDAKDELSKKINTTNTPFRPIPKLCLKTKTLNATDTFMREVRASRSDSESDSPTKKEFSESEEPQQTLNTGNIEAPESFSPKSPKRNLVFKKKALTPPQLSFSFKADGNSRM